MVAPAAGDPGSGALPRNYQRPCVLLLLAEAPAHGYDLLEQLRALGLQPVDTGALYRTLRTPRALMVGAVADGARPPHLRADRRGPRLAARLASSIKDVLRFLRRYTQRYDALVREGSRTPPS